MNQQRHNESRAADLAVRMSNNIIAMRDAIVGIAESRDIPTSDEMSETITAHQKEYLEAAAALNKTIEEMDGLLVKAREAAREEQYKLAEKEAKQRESQK